MEELTILELLKIAKKHLKLIIAIMTGLTLIVSVFIFFVISPLYSSSTQILVNSRREGEIIQGSDIDANLRLINTYENIILSPVILDEVRETLALEMTHEELSGKIRVGTQDNSQVFELEVRDESPEQAAIIANTVSETFENRIGDIMSIDNVMIIYSAIPRTVPIYPNKTLSILISLILGLMIGIAFALLLNSMDRTVKEEKFIKENLNWVFLGQIQQVPDNKRNSEGNIVTQRMPNENSAQMRNVPEVNYYTEKNSLDREQKTAVLRNRI